MKHSLRTRGRALAVAVALVAGTAGCSVTSPFQTSETQSLGDGVAVEGVPGVDIENIALVAGQDGGDAVVTGSVENQSAQQITFTIAAGTGEASTKVEPHTLVTLGDEEDLTVTGLEEGAGDMAPVEVTVNDKTVPLLVPVVLPTGYYEKYAPEGYTPPPAPTESEPASEGEPEEH